MRFITLFSLTFALLVSCDSRPDQTEDWEQTFEFPVQALDPGSNTFQFDLPQTAKTFADSHNMDPKAIQKVELISCEVFLEDGNNFDDVETILLQLSSRDANMKQLAIAENKEKGKTKIDLAIAKDNNATAYFKSDKVIAVLEVNADEGGETEYNIKAKIKFKFTSKQLTK